MLHLFLYVNINSSERREEYRMASLVAASNKPTGSGGGFSILDLCACCCSLREKDVDADGDVPDMPPGAYSAATSSSEPSRAPTPVPVVEPVQEVMEEVEDVPKKSKVKELFSAFKSPFKKGKHETKKKLAIFSPSEPKEIEPIQPDSIILPEPIKPETFILEHAPERIDSHVQETLSDTVESVQMIEQALEPAAARKKVDSFRGMICNFPHY